MKRLTNEEVRVDESVDWYLGPLANLEGMKPKLLDLILNGPVLNGVSKDVLRQIIRQLYSTLAAYEDTGLTPERCAEFARADAEGRYIVMCDAKQEGVARLRELAEADEEGRLVVLPCKVGDTVWVTGRDNVPREMRLNSPDIRTVCTDEDNLCMATCSRKPDGFCAYRLRNDGTDIGKTVFLTREEAGKVLEG